MAGAVCDKADLAAVALAVGARAQLIEQGAHGVNDLQVGLFVPAAHVVDLTQAAGLQHTADGAAMVGHIQPVADLLAVAVHRQRLARQCVNDHQRNELFRKVIGAVVVAAVGGEHRQAIGVVPGAHQMVAGGLAGRVGAVGLIAVGLGKCRIPRPQAAVHLVGGHMKEAKGRALRIGQALPVGAHALQQACGAHHIGLDKVFRAVDGAVDMAFGGKVEHSTRLVLRQQLGQQGCVADITLHKHVPCIPLQRGQVFRVASVGEFV